MTHRRTHALPLLALPLVGSVLAACGGGPDLPAMGPDRESGQSSLMDKTVAGKKTCNTTEQDRPFVIEWDATDMSMFENRAATDVVFVSYKDCNLRVLDACANDSVRGQLGAYRPVEWTSGSVEKINISDEGELYAKLPLGVATLGGRVQAGEKFTMEYFVSGVRTSTRSAAFEGDIAKIAGCKGATHFVYGFSLGAFALGSAKRLAAGADVSANGIGAGGSRVTSTNADKKGGVIESCRGESAKEIKSCQVPIRLMLRELQAGTSPESAAAANGATGGPAPADAGSVPGAGPGSNAFMEETKLRESAMRKRVQGDGKGCLADLDAADKQFPNSARSSTRPDGMMNIRGACLMMAGQCDAGKVLYRQAMEQNIKGDALDVVVKVEVDKHCKK